MAKNKDFEKVANESAQSVVNSIAATPEEQAEDAKHIEDGTTKGRKGLKMPRFNAAFTGANYEYLRIMSTLKGETMTSYLNKLVEKDREANAEQYAKAQKLIDEIN